MKPILRFTKNQKFRILMLSDIQETLTSDTKDKTIRAIDKQLETQHPDLVVLGGDNCDVGIETPEDLQEYLEELIAPMEKRKIPWTHIFGNHDHDLPFSDEVKETIYESFSCCLSSSVSGISGTTNFMIPVFASEGDKIAFALWALDSGNRTPVELEPFVLRPHVWGHVHFDQLMWYYQTSRELEEKEGRKVPGLWFQHIAPREFNQLIEHPELCGTKGNTSETMGMGNLNSGVLACVLERGDIRAMASGHSHIDTFEGQWNHILMTLDGSAGYHPYGEPESRGGRLFLLGEDGSIETHFCPHDA